MKNRFFLGLVGFCYALSLLSQPLTPVSISDNDDFSGFDQLETDGQQFFVLAEHWHNIRSVPEATLKVLKYLHQNANVRILAIEHGHSVARMINHYLESGDTVILRQVVRNTMFWSKENHLFFRNLYEYNQTLPQENRIFVRSIDIEYKMESAIFVINELIGNKEIPEALTGTLGEFKRIFETTRPHREKYQAIAVQFYYDKEFVKELIHKTMADVDDNSETYLEFFGDDFVEFATMILEMDDGLTFDYTNPNTKYKFRDKLILNKIVDLVDEFPDTGILCVIGMRHTTRGSSLYKLDKWSTSPLQDKILNIRISALFNKSFLNDLRRINFNYPRQLKNQPATLIRHDPKDPTLKSKQSFDYTLFINSDGTMTPFEKVYKDPTY